MGRCERGESGRGAGAAGERARNRCADALARSSPDGACRAQARASATRFQREKQENDVMSEKRKVIITCAVTGSIHTPTMSPHLPITPKEIADAAVGAAQAGAAIVHL